MTTPSKGKHKIESLNARYPMRRIVRQAPRVGRAEGYRRDFREGKDLLECGHEVERKRTDQSFLRSRRCTQCAPQSEDAPAPIPMVLHCPECGRQHVDAPEPQCTFNLWGENVVWASDNSSLRCQKRLDHAGAHEVGSGLTSFRWTNPPHKSHKCHGCGIVWRPADVPTVGVEAIETRGQADTWPPLKEESHDGTR
jgi:hypothetical protein